MQSIEDSMDSNIEEKHEEEHEDSKKERKSQNNQLKQFESTRSSQAKEMEGSCDEEQRM
jgi:hypothetical protein